MSRAGRRRAGRRPRRSVAAAGLAAGGGVRGALRPDVERDPDHLVPLALEQGGRDRGIDAPAHRHYDPSHTFLWFSDSLSRVYYIRSQCPTPEVPCPTLVARSPTWGGPTDGGVAAARISGACGRLSMRCPSCKSEELRVLETRDLEDAIRRRRECAVCGRRFTTFERIDALRLYVVKRDGRRGSRSTGPRCRAGCASPARSAPSPWSRSRPWRTPWSGTWWS